MQFKIVAFATLLTVAMSQTITELVLTLPKCALPCLTNAIVESGCSLVDYACQCGVGKNPITKVATPCIAKVCSISTTLGISTITDKICVLAKDLPPVVAPTVSSGNGTTNGTSPSNSTTPGNSTSGTTPTTSSPASATTTPNAGTKVQVGSLIGAFAAIMAFAL